MIEQLAIVIGVTALAMISPGPDLVIVTRNTLLGGRAAGLTTSLGILAGNLVHITYCVLGIGWLISQSIVAFTALKYAAAAYLVALGILSLVSARRPDPQPGAVRREHRHSMFLEGFINNVLNPKGTLFYLGVFSVVITPQTPAHHAALLVAVMMTISAVFWLLFVATLETAVVRRLLHGARRAVGRTFGVLLIAVGLRIALTER